MLVLLLLCRKLAWVLIVVCRGCMGGNGMGTEHEGEEEEGKKQTYSSMRIQLLGFVDRVLVAMSRGTH